MTTDYKVRLDEKAIGVIKENVLSNFGEDARVLLFGSRVDLKQKGGDIDLLVLSSLGNKEQFKAKIITLSGIHRALGEQKIDLIPWNPQNTQTLLVVQEALENGVEL